MKTLWEMEKMLVTSIVSFTHNVFFSKFKINIINLATFDLSSANAFNLVQSKLLLFGERLTLSRSSFMYLQYKYLKTLREKEKLLVTNNFSFSYSVFYPFGELSAIFIEFKIVVCNFFQFGRI